MLSPGIGASSCSMALISRADSMPWSDMEALTAFRIACWSGASSSVGECSQYFFP